MKVLVTGANGQLGMCLRSVFSNASGSNAPSVAYKMADAPSGASLPSAVFTDVDELDITNLAAIRKMVRKEGIDTIVNCAGYTDVEGAENRPDLAELLNARAVENLAVAMKEVNGLLLHISTDYVFGGEPLNSPISEDQKPAPMGVYALSKLHGEEAIRRVGCRHIIIRTAWMFSRFGNNFVKTMRRLTSERTSLNVVYDQVGTPTFADDLAAFIVYVIESGQLGKTGTYNYTNLGVPSWYDFAVAIRDLSGNSCRIEPCLSSDYPRKASRPHYAVLDKSLVQKTFGIAIPHWYDSLKKCVEQLEANGN